MTETTLLAIWTSGSLKGNIGNQNYEIPVNVDVTGYGSVVIYCAPFHVIFATAPLG